MNIKVNNCLMLRYITVARKRFLIALKIKSFAQNVRSINKILIGL